VVHRGRTELAMDCALAGAEAQHGRPLNLVVRQHRMSVEEIADVFEKSAPSDAEFKHFAMSYEEDPAKAFDALSISVARRFSAGALTYEAADQIMNGVYGYAVKRAMKLNEVLPSLMLRVYEAFDAGEYVHRGDSREVDPVAKYTRPAIQELLREFGAV